MTTLESYIATAQPLIDHWGNVAVFVCIFAEGIGIPAPGQTILIAGALLAGRGQFAIAPLLAVAVIAAAVGNTLGWAIGRHGGRPLMKRYTNGQRLARIERHFQRSSVGVVALGRFVEGARQLNGLAAGALGMERVRFLTWNLIGAVLWVGFWGLGAYALSRDFEEIASVYDRIRPFLALAVVLGGSLALVWLLGKRPGAVPSA